MALATAIKFRHLASQLNQDETAQFVAILSRQRESMILKALFMFFVQSTNGETENHNANNIISKIIRSRKKTVKTQSIDQASNLKLDRIPRQLIGATATFLKQTDYINLSNTNRSVYLGCNAPNSLQELNLLRVKDYSSINLALYPSVKTLKLKLSKFKDLMFPQGGSLVMNQLKSLILEGAADLNLDIDGFLAVAKQQMNTDNVRALKLKMFGAGENRFDVDALYKILRTFPNILNLDLSCLFLNAVIDSTKMNELYPRLTVLRLMVRPTPSAISLVQHYGQQLNSLSIADRDLNLDIGNVDFSNLQTLNLSVPSAKVIKDILKTAVNLKSIKMVLQHWKSMDAASIPSEIKHSVANSLTSCPALEFMNLARIHKNGQYLLSALEGLEKGLFESKAVRERLRIIIRIYRIDNIKDVMLKVGNVVNWARLRTNDFMLMFDCDRNSKVVNKIVKDLQAISVEIQVKRYEKLFVISNRCCQINGFQSVEEH